jgi:hypothetical protein
MRTHWGELLSSRYGWSCGRAILESLEDAEPVDITMNDGSVVHLELAAEASGFFQRYFGWLDKARPALQGLDHGPASPPPDHPAGGVSF